MLHKGVIIYFKPANEDPEVNRLYLILNISITTVRYRKCAGYLTKEGVSLLELL